jgi:hypothetical protein
MQHKYSDVVFSMYFFSFPSKKKKEADDLMLHNHNVTSHGTLLRNKPEQYYLYVITSLLAMFLAHDNSIPTNLTANGIAFI